MERIQATDTDRTWLFIFRIEEVLGAVARVLNGAREQLGRLRGVVVFVRENRRGEFQQLCPDLMDWVGLRICLADQFSYPSRYRGHQPIPEPTANAVQFAK